MARTPHSGIVQAIVRTAVGALLVIAPAAGIAQDPAPIVLAAGTSESVDARLHARFSTPVVIEMPAQGAMNVAALTAVLRWNPAHARLDSVRAGGFGTLVHNAAEARDGRLVLSIFNGTGTTRSVTLATLHFTAIGAPGASPLSVQPTVAGNEVGENILASLVSRGTVLCVGVPDASCSR